MVVSVDSVSNEESARIKSMDESGNTTIKKKKKKKRRNSALSNDAFSPNVEEDNIVIPEN
jgi:hypothetical protein